MTGVAFFSPHPPAWFVFIYVSSCCICCMLVNIWGRILDTVSVAALANEEVSTVGAMVGAESGIWV